MTTNHDPVTQEAVKAAVEAGIAYDANHIPAMRQSEIRARAMLEKARPLMRTELRITLHAENDREEVIALVPGQKIALTVGTLSMYTIQLLPEPIVLALEPAEFEMEVPALGFPKEPE